MFNGELGMKRMKNNSTLQITNYKLSEGGVKKVDLVFHGLDALQAFLIVFAGTFAGCSFYDYYKENFCKKK